MPAFVVRSAGKGGDETLIVVAACLNTTHVHEAVRTVFRELAVRSRFPSNVVCCVWTKIAWDQ